MEFYALPEEIDRWLTSVVTEGQNWVLCWHVRPNIYAQVLPEPSANNQNLWSIKDGPGPHFFIGSKSFFHKPIMRKRLDGHEEIDFLHSLCVRLVPSFFSQTVLLEGRVETFPYTKYEHLQNAKEFWKWKGKLLSSLKKQVFPTSAVATQLLKSGTEKMWNTIFFSQAAIDWSAGGGKLKQFADGSVEIIPRPKSN